MRKIIFLILVSLLSVLGTSALLYKIFKLEFPLTPEDKAPIWIVETNIKFRPFQRAVKIELALPDDGRFFEKIDEDFISKDYGLTFTQKDQTKLATWAIRYTKLKNQNLYYRGVFRALEQKETKKQKLSGKQRNFYLETKDFEAPYQDAALSLIDEIKAISADEATFVTALIQAFGQKKNEHVKLLKGYHLKKKGLTPTLLVRQILRMAKIPTRKLTGFELKDNQTIYKPVVWLEVFINKKWQAVDPTTGSFYLPNKFLVWTHSDNWLNFSGAKKRDVSFHISQGYRPFSELSGPKSQSLNSFFHRFALYQLPLDIQKALQMMLLIPLGAFLVVFMRNFIGVQTAGTFMPILIALAFRQTQLTTGLVLFGFVIAIGLSLRFLLEKLNLLAVPRVATVLTMIVMLLIGMTFLSYELKLYSGLQVSLFPIVILAWTVEKMSIAWEERGGMNALKQILGSLVVALVCYFIFVNDTVVDFLFLFPETLFILLALMLLMGRYTGYRLTELKRFRDLVKSAP